jgi:hypothetical protein
LQLKPGNKSGYYGVIPNKGKWQGKGYDPRKKAKGSLPGLYDKPQDAAMQVARFEGWCKRGTRKIPSPKKCAPRGTGERLQCVLLLPVCLCHSLDANGCVLVLVCRQAREAAEPEDLREHRGDACAP